MNLVVAAPDFYYDRRVTPEKLASSPKPVIADAVG